MTAAPDRFAGRHGRIGTYQLGCRCEVCRAAQAEYQREYYRAGRTDPAERDPGAVIAARIADVFAERDAARMRELDDLIRNGGTCRYCGTVLTDTSLERHPGLCGSTGCKRRAVADVLRDRAGGVAVAQEPRPERKPSRSVRARRADGPCPDCGSKAYRHRNGCPKSWAAQAAERKSA
jgi:hypothetical protein